MPDPPRVEPADIESILDSLGRDRAFIVPILEAIQHRWNYLPEEALRLVAEKSRITPADLEGVSTFYPRFRHTPSGLHRIRVCVGTACHVKGGESIFGAFRDALKIPESSDTDPEGTFTVEKAACLGCCMLAPVVQIDDDAVYGHLTRQSVTGVLRDFLGSRRDSTDAGSVAAPNGAGTGIVSLCTCTSCRASGAQVLFEALAREARTGGLPVEVRRAACMGISYRAPVVEVSVSGAQAVRYAGVSPADASAILLRHFRSSRRAPRLKASATRLLDRIAAAGAAAPPVQRLGLDLESGPDGAFWSPQVRIVTEQTGTDPLDFAGFRATGGLEALFRCTAELTPQGVIDLLRESGLRGRGGAGYPTAGKWESVRSAAAGPRIVICNADEGDPGAFMDRLLLESFPFRVLEGMAIAAYATDAYEALFFVRAEYPLALSRVRRALATWKAEVSLPGQLRFEVVEGAGAFVCGEETAMIAAIEGRRGTPVARPPYPAESGLRGLPTLVNNVETFAAVPWIVRNGARAFRSVGTPDSPGTKTFALAGRVARGGLIEVPMGMSIRTIVDEIGGGLQDGGKLKAVQIGGPSGGCIPAALVDIPVDYESLGAAGAMMGSGGMVVLDESDCMVDLACYFTAFTAAESCGKCTCCRAGSHRMHELLRGLCEGRGSSGDLPLLQELALAMTEGGLCGLGRSAANPVLSTIRHFRSEYESHVAGLCPAGRCKALISFVIGAECIGCTRCSQQCPAGAIEARPFDRHHIDEARCIRCGGCRQACPSGAVHVQPRSTAAAPVEDCVDA